MSAGGEEKGRVDAGSPNHSSCRTEFRAGGHDVDKLDKTQERATHTQKKMMERLEGLNDEGRLKELNMDRLAKHRLKVAIRTVRGHLNTSREEGPHWQAGGSGGEVR